MVFREGEAVYWLHCSGKAVPATVLHLSPHRHMVPIRLEVGDHKTRTRVWPRILRRRDVRNLSVFYRRAVEPYTIGWPNLMASE